MIKEIQYTSIHRVMDELMRHPMLNDLTIDQAVSYTLSFISVNGFPNLYQDKTAEMTIQDYRTVLPCDLISIVQVKDTRTGICLRSMTDNFPRGMGSHTDDVPFHEQLGEPSFKTQGRVLYTSFPEGTVEVVYKTIPVDEDGFPMLIDNEVYLLALKAYIKQEVFTIKFDKGELSERVLAHAEKDYCWRAGQLDSEFRIPSVSEMESIARNFNTMIPKLREFDNGFRNLGDREYLRKH